MGLSQCRLVALAVVSIAAAAAARGWWGPLRANASDHNEPQSINGLGIDPLDPSDDRAADAADIYGNFAFTTDDSVVFIVTWPAPERGFEYLGGREPGEDWDETHLRAYDPGVLYAVHLDLDRRGISLGGGAADAEVTIYARFGYDHARRRWGVKVEGVPGEEAAIVGRVGSRIDGVGGSTVQAGLFDEPFFVDLERFFEGLVVEDESNLAAAVLNFRDDVDFFEGYNVHALVVEVPKRNIASAGLWSRRELGAWTSTYRIPETDSRLLNRPELQACVRGRR